MGGLPLSFDYYARPTSILEELRFDLQYLLHSSELRPRHSCEIYEPKTNIWTTAADVPITGWIKESIALSDGSVFISAGSRLARKDEFAIYDSRTGKWYAVPPSEGSGVKVGLLDGRVLQIGDDCQLYGSGVWSKTASFPGALSGCRAVALPDGRILVFGLINKGNPETSCEIYDPESATWKKTDDMVSSNWYPIFCRLLDGKVLAINAGISQIFDPATEKWHLTKALPPGSNVETAIALKDGRVLLVAPGDLCLIFDPKLDHWTTTGALNCSRSMFTATLLNDGRVLVAGGVAFVPYTSVDREILATCEVYDPVTGKWTLLDSRR